MAVTLWGIICLQLCPPPDSRLPTTDLGYPTFAIRLHPAATGPGGAVWCKVGLRSPGLGARPSGSNAGPSFYSQILVSPLLHLSTSIAQCQRGPLARLWHPGGTGHITLNATVKGQLLKEVVSSGWSWIRPPVAPTCMYPGCDPGRVIMEQPRQAGTPYSAELSDGLGSDFHFSSETAHLQGNEPTFSLLPPGQAS